jgi:hypothetical protein
MRSAFAAFLRGFVLPFGATGQRIVFDGDNGRIDVYNNANQLIGRFGPVGNAMFVSVADPGGARAVLAAGSGSSQLLLDPPDWSGHTIVTGTLQGDIDTGTGQPFIVIGSPTVDGGDDLRVFLFGETTGGDRPALYIDGGSGLPADLLLNGRSMPRGWLTTLSSTGVSPALAAIGGVQTLPGTSYTITNNSGMTRRYKVTISARFNSAVAAGLYRPHVTDGATTALGPGTAAVRSQGVGGPFQVGSHDIYVLTVADGATQTVGAGGLRASAGAATDVITTGDLTVEDIGPL